MAGGVIRQLLRRKIQSHSSTLSQHKDNEFMS